MVNFEKHVTVELEVYLTRQGFFDPKWAFFEPAKIRPFWPNFGPGLINYMYSHFSVTVEHLMSWIELSSDWFSWIEMHGNWVFDKFCKMFEPLGTNSAINGSMIT